MISYIIRKILSSLLTLFLLTILVFILVHVIMPGDYVSQFLGMSIEDKTHLRNALGLDLPLWRQYLRWVTGVLNGRLGMSFSGFSVLDAILSRLPYTMLVFVSGGWIAFLAGQWLGKTTGWRSRPIVSEGAALAVIALYSFFPPALGFLLRYTLGNRLGWFPISPTIDFYQFERDFPGISQSYVMDCMMFSLASALLFVLFFYLVLHKWAKIRLSGLVSMLLIAAIWVAGWFIAGVGLPAIRMIYHAAIPLFAFILLSMGEMTIITRTSLAETKREEYILTARAKGLTDAQIRDRHAIRNAYLPVISKAIVSLPYLIAGLAIIEYSLIWPGLGSGVFSAVLVQDVPLALGYLLFIGVFSLGARLLLELAYLALDPRLRYVVQKVGVNL